MNNLQPPEAALLTPSAQAGEWLPQAPIQGSHGIPEATLGHRRGEEELPEPQGREPFRVPRVDPLEKGGAASGKAHDEEWFTDGDLPISPEEQIIQEKPDPVDSLKQEEERNEQGEKPQPLRGPGACGSRREKKTASR